MRRLIHRYLEHLQGERQLSPQTLRAYEHDLVTFHRFLARDFLGKEPDAVRPEDVDPLAVRSFLAALTRSGLGKKSQGRALSAVRSLFRFACREGTLAANPAQGVKTPKAPQTLPRHLRPGEVERLIAERDGAPEIRIPDDLVVFYCVIGVRRSRHADPEIIPLSCISISTYPVRTEPVMACACQSYAAARGPEVSICDRNIVLKHIGVAG